MSINEVLLELEDLSAKALESASARDTITAEGLIVARGEAIEKLKNTLTESSPLSYTDWNRLVIIHYQGNRIAEALEAARVVLANEFVEMSREHAYLECVSGFVNTVLPAQLNEQV